MLQNLLFWVVILLLHILSSAIYQSDSLYTLLGLNPVKVQNR